MGRAWSQEPPLLIRMVEEDAYLIGTGVQREIARAEQLKCHGSRKKTLRDWRSAENRVSQNAAGT